MTQDEALRVLLKLTNGDLERCYQLIETISQQYPGKSKQWYFEKAIYDLRFGKKAVKANPTLSRWGEGGGSFRSNPSAAPPAPATAKQPPQLPPPPLPMDLRESHLRH